jgi:hypothetical protein
MCGAIEDFPQQDCLAESGSACQGGEQVGIGLPGDGRSGAPGASATHPGLLQFFSGFRLSSGCFGLCLFQPSAAVYCGRGLGRSVG